ncbi:MAG: thiamine-binding protein [Chitinophagaceae bacterium]|nr:MAG: thiamine-binding protein [Chitinophagaceae bacterium]
MHGHIINASIQLLPVTADRHPYEWVDEAIAIIQQSGLRYEVGPFATILEGKYEEVFCVIHAVNDHLLASGCPEWISSIQVQIRSSGDITGEEKTRKFV